MCKIFIKVKCCHCSVQSSTYTLFDCLIEDEYKGLAVAGNQSDILKIFFCVIGTRSLPNGIFLDNCVVFIH